MEKKQCPFCGEEIDVNADVCPVCCEKIPPEQEPNQENDPNSTEKPVKKKNGWVKALLVTVLSIVILSLGAAIGFFVMNKELVSDFIHKTSYLEKGIEYYNNSDFENAKMLLNKQIQKDSNADAYYYLAKIYEKENSEYAVIYNYSQAYRLNPQKYADILVPLVKLCIKNENEDGIKEFIKSAYEAKSDDMQIAEAYAKKLVDDENLSEAVKILKVIAQKNTKNFYANSQLAHYYYDQGNYPEAYTYAKRLPVDGMDAVKFLASICIERDYYKEAMTLLNNAASRFGYDDEMVRLYNTALNRQYAYNYSRDYYD